ncbi:MULTISPECIES: DUF2508 family protein [Paenibacillus]|uniref:Uncharacterized protein n=1 Tax=Paenibacillus naphthalenovorans TaxID=162209 RepID=A0A0U2WBB9_9BACL|nr:MULTISPECIES: DUF2508 family protein [Paenibacillus]ALS24765.1 hypothetical protein IJ22_44790 [Paenibacillus naphthalenovorans]NTZ19654.1 DUF2508 family protein [Paenibacillus sp. JMULE4]GCL73905.1 DUF2508 domain-containing protein [Paenibacillus naphthalenovorans]SDJ07886.1 Protein of unknown function [Paenibacillus naphthalenovorans]
MKQWILKLWKRKERKREDAIQNDRLLLVQEIRKAHLEWETAQKRFDYVIEKEQIDYAVFALETAEKRFEMLIRQAKNMRISPNEVWSSFVLEESS